MVNEKVFKIFIDFDGTITKVDVGEMFTDIFGDPDKNKEIIRLWVEDKITSPESWYLMFENVLIDENKFNEFIATVQIDKTFIDFIDYSIRNNFEIRVLSDGFDIYINKILERENITGLEVYCNKAIINPVKSILPGVNPANIKKNKTPGKPKTNFLEKESLFGSVFPSSIFYPIELSWLHFPFYGCP